MKKIITFQPKVKRPALDQSRFQITKLADLISLYCQWNNYSHTVAKLAPAEAQEINRLAGILSQFLPNWEEKLLNKHVSILEKNDWWGIGKELTEVSSSDLQTLYSEWTAYQKLAGSFLKPEISAKIKFVRKVYQRISEPPRSSPLLSHHRSREPTEPPPIFPWTYTKKKKRESGTPKVAKPPPKLL